MKDFTLKQAIEIARIEYNIGIWEAIDKLEELGFNVQAFYDTFKKYYYLNDNDFEKAQNEIFLEARDNTFKDLRISDLMNKAYEILQNEGL